MNVWTNASSVSNRLSAAWATLPAGALELACHAAVPVAVDAGFLHLLRINFFLDPPVALGYDVEAELLTSPLFRELGDGLYEIDSRLRDRLLVSLLTRYGSGRLTRVAALLEQYTDQGAPWPALPELEHAQRLTALSIIEPARAIEWLEQAQRSSDGDGQLGREWFVAMRHRLEQQPSVSSNLNGELGDLLERARAGAEARRITATYELGQLGLLPGADVATIARALDELADQAPPSVAAVAREVLDTLVLLVPAPAAAGDEQDATAQRDEDVSLLDLLGIPDPRRPDLRRLWRRPVRDQLRVPIGVNQWDGRPVQLDLKEAALEGVGPHGLLIGATGSGKSELLRTLVLGLAATHSPEAVNVVLVDFRSGATFRSLDRLPHVAAAITNLGDEPALVDRLAEALGGELARRQRVLQAADHVSRYNYEQARAQGEALAPLPSLLVVCDEFTELLTAKPDLIEVFNQIGRVGRSLGVHLLLAGQRLEEGRLRGLETFLSYRIGLRTFSASESRALLGVPDAYELPRSPGHGYLKVDLEPPVRFKAAYVSGPYRDPAAASWDDVLSTPDRLSYLPSICDVLAETLAGQGVPARQLWLPPLTTPPTMDELVGPVRVDPVRGLTMGHRELYGTLRVPVGLVDKPFEQRRDVLWLELSGAGAHVAVVGGPGSGRSTALRTLITGLALTHTPAEAQVYCLDFDRGQLAALRELPHVGGVSGRLDAAAVRRTVGEVASLLADRMRRFEALGVESMATYRGRVAAGAAEDPFGEVFLVVDGWDVLRREYDNLELPVTGIAEQGLPYGIHVIATATTWTEFRPAIRDLFGTRLELRLRDPRDSEISPKAAANVPVAAPGRGITGEQLHFLTALPRLTGGEPADLVSRIAAGWTGPLAPRLRALPDVVPFSAIEDIRDEDRPLVLPIGIAEADLRPVFVDFAADPHVVLFGDALSGKSTFLRLVATLIASRFAPQEARMVVVDYRRSLLGAVPTDHLLGYGASAAQASELIQSVAAAMRDRLPGSDVTAEQLRDRSWWTGPECFVLVDDYDLVAGGTGNPMLALAELLPHARDIGLHLILARRSGGAGRAIYEPVIQRLRDLSSPGLILSGDPDEGPLLGNVRPSPQPPGRGWLVTRDAGARIIQVAYPQAD